MKRPVFILVIGGVVMIAIVLSFILFELNRPTPAPSVPSPSASASAEPVSDEHVHGDGDRSAFDAKQQEIRDNPILRSLPHDTRFWSLEYGGVEEGRYVLEARIFRSPSESPESVISEQQPFIEAYVQATGQPDGTYVIRYSTVDAKNEEENA